MLVVELWTAAGMVEGSGDPAEQCTGQSAQKTHQQLRLRSPRPPLPAPGPAV